MTTKSTTTTVASLATSLKTSPKVVRGKLRRAGYKPSKEGWKVTAAMRKAISA